MRSIFAVTGLGLVALAVQAGCRSDRVPPPSPARVPWTDDRRMASDWETAKPLPAPARDELPPPPFDDVPFVSQEAPEVPRFVNAYNQVGRPRIVVWVGHAPGDYYDEASTRDVDYAAMENVLTDWLAANGRVAVVSPQAARQALSPQQAQDLNSGHPANSREIGDRLRADILVFVRAQPTHQSGAGPAVRLVADASNVAGGESLGQVVVDIPPPLEKQQINKYTRFVVRKLMADMTNAWGSAGGSPPPVGAVPPPPQPLPQEPVSPRPDPAALQPPAPAPSPTTRKGDLD